VIVPDPGELQDLVRELHHQATPWLPAGLASRLDWGAPLRQPCAVVSAARLRGIVEHSAGDFILRVAAGTPLQEIQQELARHRQWLALDPPLATAPADDPASAQGSIGGLVARGLAGGYRQRYLGVRDQLIGIRVLRADGVAARAGGKVVKNVAGYDLMRLFTGSWGSLGLITELTLRTMPLPLHRAGVLLRGPAQGLSARVDALLRAGLTPERLDLWSPALAAAAGLEAEPQLLVAVASVSAEGLGEQLAAIGAGAGHQGLASRPCSAGELAALLAAVRPQAAAPGAPDPAAWLLRLGVTPSRVAELLERQELAPLAVDLAAASGLGMAWGPASALSPAQVTALRGHCKVLGGQLTVLRQPGAASGATDAVSAWEDAPSRALIEAVKSRFDPKLQLAPGRLPGVARPTLAPPAPALS
jgi:glycolate oxidase FAD binding subunit